MEEEIHESLIFREANHAPNWFINSVITLENAKEYHEKALAIAIEIGNRGGEGTIYGNLGSVFHSLRIPW